MNREPIDDDEMVRLIFPMMDERNRRIFDEDGARTSPTRWKSTGRSGSSA